MRKIFLPQLEWEAGPLWKISSTAGMVGGASAQDFFRSSNWRQCLCGRSLPQPEWEALLVRKISSVANGRLGLWLDVFVVLSG